MSTLDTRVIIQRTDTAAPTITR